MPKTYTDDLAPALPSAIEGPLQVIDPSDYSSWIKIDPAGVRIAAAGDARPTRCIATSFARSYGSGTASYMASVLACRIIASSSIGGMYFQPFQIPSHMDTSKTSNVRIVVSPAANATTNGQVIRLALDEAHVTDGGGSSNSNPILDWEVPDDWTTSDFNLVTIDSGSGYTFAADTFQAGDLVGLKIMRCGLAPEDTFDKSVRIADTVLFECTVKEY